VVAAAVGIVAEIEDRKRIRVDKLN
jgi:hypothetical protein